VKAGNPYLNFAGNTWEAFTFYQAVFGGEFLQVLRYGDMEGNTMHVADDELDKIAHIGLPLGKNGGVLMGTDVVPSFPKPLKVGNNFYITLEPETREEAERLFDDLTAGGEVEMPLEQTPWAELYGSCVDRFGVQWMVNYGGAVEAAYQEQLAGQQAK
jgi:PhnB protein